MENKYYVAVNGEWEEVTIVRKYFALFGFYYIMSNTLIVPDSLLITKEQSEQRSAKHWTPVFKINCKKYDLRRATYFDRDRRHSSMY